MLIPVLAFMLVLGIVLGMYWLFIVRPERATEAALRKRLVPTVKPAARVLKGIQREAERLSSVPALDRLLAARAGIVGPIGRLIEQSGVRTTVGVVVLSMGCLVMLGVLIGEALLHSLALGLLLGACLALAPVLFLRWKRTKRVQRFEELFPEALDLMSRAMRAGHTFGTAIGMVADELPEPIASEFQLLHDQQNFGLPFDDALRNFGERVPLLAGKFFVTAILTQRESGGNLTEVLENLASVIRARFTVKRQVRIKSAHGRITGWILVAMPPVLAVILSIINPQHFSPMLADRLGIQMLVAAVILQIVGALLIRRIVNPEF